MRAVILAGGKGTRLRPFTATFPKPLLPIGDVPILEVNLRQLAHYGFERVTLAVGGLAELISAFAGDGSKFGLRIDYSKEEQPLGTAAPLTRIDDLPENFLCMNGDLLTTLHFGEFLRDHVESGSVASIAAHSKDVAIDLGVIETDGNGSLSDYIEKPTMRYLVSMGIYAFNRHVVDEIPGSGYFDFPSLILQLRDRRKQVRIVRSEEFWLDIGRHDDYALAQEEFERRRHLFLPGDRAGLG